MTRIIIIQLFALLISIFQVNADGISCFKCVTKIRKVNDSLYPCSQFDVNNPKYQVFCPSSTLCMSRTIFYKYPNGTQTTTTVERDCAPQLHKFKAYDFEQEDWFKKEEVVTSAYTEGCFMGEDRGSPIGPPQYCFCSFHLCNSSSVMKSTTFYIFMKSVLIILSTLYII